MTEQVKKQMKGFATMTSEERSRIASLGGRAAHLKGTAHQFTSEEAREAGRKGGLAGQRRKAALSAGSPKEVL